MTFSHIIKYKYNSSLMQLYPIAGFVDINQLFNNIFKYNYN